MQTVDLLGDQISVTGALELDRGPNGIGVRRLPGWTRPQIPDPFMDAMVSSCSGVRLEFESDTEVVELARTMDMTQDSQDNQKLRRWLETLDEKEMGKYEM